MRLEQIIGSLAGEACRTIHFVLLYFNPRPALEWRKQLSRSCLVHTQKYIIILEPWLLGRQGEDPTRGRVVRQVSGGGSIPLWCTVSLSPCSCFRKSRSWSVFLVPSSLSAAQPHSLSPGCAARRLLWADYQVIEGPAWLCLCWLLLPSGPLLRASVDQLQA